MKPFKIRTRPFTKPKRTTRVSKQLATEAMSDERNQVIVKIAYSTPARVRIWPTTFLICKQTGYRAKLVQSYNIGKYPNWIILEPNSPFSLIFEGLPRGCRSFDLLEDIPETDELFIGNISRNKSDVYNFLLD